MDFSEKISIILRTNKLQLVTKEDLSEYCGFHRDTIRKAIDRGTGLKDKYLRIFQDKLGISPDWWDTGKGDIYVSKHTQDEKAGDNKQNDQFNESVYRTIIEGHTEYLLVPRSVLNETQLVSTEQIKRTWDELAEKNKEIAEKNKELERKNKQIDFYQDRFAKLLENMELTTKPSKAKEV
jgi:hypothetical protein